MKRFRMGLEDLVMVKDEDVKLRRATYLMKINVMGINSRQLGLDPELFLEALWFKVMKSNGVENRYSSMHLTFFQQFYARNRL